MPKFVEVGMRACVAWIFILSAPIPALADYYSPEAGAKVTANFLNEGKTMQGVIDGLASGLSAQDADGLKAFFMKKDFKDQDKTVAMPHAKAVGATVVFENSKFSIEFRKDRSVRLG